MQRLRQLLLPLIVLLLTGFMLTTWASGEVGTIASAPQAAKTTADEICSVGAGAALPWPRQVATGTVQLVYNAHADEYLALGLQYDMGDPTTMREIAWRIDADGQPIGQPTDWAWENQQSIHPVAAYNPTDQRYLVIRSYGPTGVFGEPTSPLYYQMLGDDLTRLGDPQFPTTPISTGSHPAVTYNPDDNEFFIVWNDPTGMRRTDNTPLPTLPPGTATVTPAANAPTPTPAAWIKGLYAYRVQGDGTRIDIEGGLLVSPVTGASESVGDVQVVYNAHSQEYLVLWVEAGRIYTRRLNHLGEPLAAAAALTAAGEGVDRLHLAYNSQAHDYLAVWSEASESTLSDVVGLRLTEQGQPQGAAFALLATPSPEFPTDLVYQPAHDEYLLAWSSDEGTLFQRSLQRLTGEGALLGDAISTDGGVFSLGVNTTRGDYLALTQFGYRAQPLTFAPCAATPTPGASLPTPEQGLARVVQWERPVFGAEPELRGARRWTFLVTGNTLTLVSANSLTHMDERLGPLEVGASVWVTSYLEEGMEVAESIVVLPPDHVVMTPTAAPSATATPAPPATFCELAPVTTLPWPPGTDTDDLIWVHNTQADEFVALGVQFVSAETQVLVAMRVSAQGALLAGPIPVVMDNMGIRPALAYSAHSNAYLLVWGHHQPYQDNAVLRAQSLAADLTPLSNPVLLETQGDWPTLTYNPDDDEFLVLWRSDRDAPPAFVMPFPLPTGVPTLTPMPGPRWTTYLQRVKADGTLVGSARGIVTPAMPLEVPSTPLLAYNTHDHEYLVIGLLFAQRLSRTGEPVGDYVRLEQPDQRSALVYNSQDNQYLLAGMGFESGNAAGSGVVLSALGAAAGQPQTLLPGRNLYPITVKAVYNAARHTFVVASDSDVRVVSAEGVATSDAVATTPRVRGLGVNAQGQTVVLEGYGRLVRVLDFEPHCTAAPTPTPGAPAPTPTPFTVPGLVTWQGEIEAIEPVGDLARWTVGGQAVTLTWLTRVDTSSGEAQVGATVQVTAHQLDSGRVAQTIVVQQPTEPPLRPFTLYLPLVSRQPQE